MVLNNHIIFIFIIKHQQQIWIGDKKGGPILHRSLSYVCVC